MNRQLRCGNRGRLGFLWVARKFDAATPKLTKSGRYALIYGAISFSISSIERAPVTRLPLIKKVGVDCTFNLSDALLRIDSMLASSLRLASLLRVSRQELKASRL
jgi:hypothetical protein